MATVDIPIKLTVEGLVSVAAVARPGDTLVIGLARAISDEEYGYLQESFRPLADRGIAVAFADQVTSMVVARTSETPEAEELDPDKGSPRSVTLESYAEPGER